MIAHGLTGLRLLLVVPTALAFADPVLWPAWYLALFIVVAIASDVLDGVMARRHGTASAAGQLFDHGTDCLFVAAALAGAAHAGLVTWLLPPLVLVAFGQYVLDSRLLHRERQLRGSFIGRWNGVLYFVPLVVLAASRLETFAPLETLLLETGRWMAWLLVASTLLSILDRAVAPLRQGATG